MYDDEIKALGHCKWCGKHTVNQPEKIVIYDRTKWTPTCKLQTLVLCDECKSSKDHPYRSIERVLLIQFDPVGDSY